MKKRNILLAIGILLIILYLFRGVFIDPLIREVKSRIKDDFNNAISFQNSSREVSTKTIVTQIGFISDIHNDAQHLEKAISKINQSNVSAVYILGDLTDTGTDKELSTIKEALKKLNKKYYIIPGDHDFWAGRQVENNASKIFNSYFSDKLPKSIDHQHNLDLLYINNADIYNGVPEYEITEFERGLTQSVAKNIIIISHRAIYHPLTIHRMGYINNEENETVLKQSRQIQDVIKKNKTKNITIINGDLHTSSKYTFLDTELSAYSIGAVTNERNFQTPRYGTANLYTDNTLEIINSEL
jgi:hypothetical protein